MVHGFTVVVPGRVVCSGCLPVDLPAILPLAQLAEIWLLEWFAVSFVFLSAYFGVLYLPSYRVAAAVFLGVVFSLRIPVGFLEFLALVESQ